jgi:hypothetical protein
MLISAPVNTTQFFGFLQAGFLGVLASLREIVFDVT